MFFDDPYDFRYDPFGYGGYDDGFNRRNFAQVSQRARGVLEDAKTTFLKHLATVDTSKGPVSEEIIKNHMVPDMRKAFSKFVKEYGCTATSRQLTRLEQDGINKNRKSLMWYTSVTVTPKAQEAFLAKDPGQAKHNKHRVAAAAAKATAQPTEPEASTSKAESSAVAAKPVVRDLTAAAKRTTLTPIQAPASK